MSHADEIVVIPSFRFYTLHSRSVREVTEGTSGVNLHSITRRLFRIRFWRKADAASINFFKTDKFVQKQGWRRERVHKALASRQLGSSHFRMHLFHWRYPHDNAECLHVPRTQKAKCINQEHTRTVLPLLARRSFDVRFLCCFKIIALC